ncbi:hypothetical protein DUI87_16784 [Hirundo rustica rustica]|uniref:Uncharacterized protein n=1 Tax=Hirundo rustica rustica TaxID=333673 RepID=A0A3M0K268_HIRRU|nr:hypothetical protein DUI87_16784 [Hirundo rustica rustica]
MKQDPGKGELTAYKVSLGLQLELVVGACSHSLASCYAFEIIHVYAILYAKSAAFLFITNLDISFVTVTTTSKSKTKKKATKTQEAKKILKKKFKVNTKIVFTEDGELVQQWPPVQKSNLAQADEEDDASGINLDKAKEILREEDKFDKEEYRKKVKEKHREKRLKEKAARREARNKNAQSFDSTINRVRKKLLGTELLEIFMLYSTFALNPEEVGNSSEGRHNDLRLTAAFTQSFDLGRVKHPSRAICGSVSTLKPVAAIAVVPSVTLNSAVPVPVFVDGWQMAEEETVAFLAHSGSEEEFDPSTLPDPDKYKDSDAEQDSESEESYSELEEETGRKKRSYSNSATAEEMPLKRKKMQFSQEEDSYLPLDTGLSLAEDEELVLHLLKSHN